MMDILKVLGDLPFSRIAPFGSREVGCETKESDYDYLVLVNSRPTLDDMADTGFVPDAQDPLYGEDFSSWRKDDVNLVFTDLETYFNAALEACQFCKKYKVYDKVDRCMIHEKFRGAAKCKDLQSSLLDFTAI